MRHLLVSEIDWELNARPGLIPIRIRPDENTVDWLDFGGYHCYHGFFHNALAEYRFLKSDALGFCSSLDVLDQVPIPIDSVVPTGFIFHAGRCGSTVLAQALARSRSNMVFGEVSAHNRVWNCTAGKEQTPDGIAAERFRRLVLLMGRRRLPGYRSHIVKFTSYNILRLPMIRQAFPEVPIIFLYRNPAALLRSYRQALPGWMGKPVVANTVLSTPEIAVEMFFHAALAVRDPLFRCLDYERLEEALPSVLECFGIRAASDELRHMKQGFGWDAKAGAIPRLYCDSRRSGATATDPMVPEALATLYSDLKSMR